MRLFFTGRQYAGREYLGLEFGATVAPVPNAQPDRRDGAIRKKHRRPPLVPLVIEQPTPQSLQAERERRESREAHENVWAKAFAESRRPRTEAVVRAQRVSGLLLQSMDLLGGDSREAEDEMLLFGEILGLDAEVIL